jgi:hypothetical protein
MAKGELSTQRCRPSAELFEKRVGEFKFAKELKNKLVEIVKQGVDAIDENVWICRVCSKPTTKRCSLCTSTSCQFYCSMPHQAADWVMCHRKEIENNK